MRAALPNPELVRQRARTRPPQLAIPPSSSGGVIATALVSSLCSVPLSTADSNTWSSLITFEDAEPTNKDSNDVPSDMVVGSAGAGTDSEREPGVGEDVDSHTDGQVLPGDRPRSAEPDALQLAAVADLPDPEDLTNEQPDLPLTDDRRPRGGKLRRSGRFQRALTSGGQKSKARSAAAAAAISQNNSKRNKRSAGRPDRSSKFNTKPKGQTSSNAAGARGGARVEEAEDTEGVGTSKKRKNRSNHQTPKSKKQKIGPVTANISGLLDEVEANPPQVSCISVKIRTMLTWARCQRKQCRCGDTDQTDRREHFHSLCIKNR
jgi:hypothetical protein